MLTLTGAKKLLALGTINMPLDTWISSNSKFLEIYRHTYINDTNLLNPSSALIWQMDDNTNSIEHTNNW